MMHACSIRLSTTMACAFCISQCVSTAKKRRTSELGKGLNCDARNGNVRHGREGMRGDAARKYRGREGKALDKDTVQSRVVPSYSPVFL